MSIGERMFVVLDGPDCTGKTTLAAKLSEHYNVPVIKQNRHPDRTTLVDKVLADIVDYSPVHGAPKVAFGEGGVIFDRWQFPSNIIYEELFRGEPSALKGRLSTIVNESKKANILFLILDANNETIKARLDVRGDEFYGYTQIIQAAEKYREFLSSWLMTTHLRAPIRTINTSNRTPEDVFEAAVRAIDMFYLLGAKEETR